MNILFYFALLVSFGYCSLSLIPITEDVIINWAQTLENKIIIQLNRLTGIKLLEKSFSNLKQAKLIPIDGNKLVEKMARELSMNLQSKTEALQKLVDVAESSLRTYKYNSNLELDDVTWISVKDFTETDDRLVYSDKFKRRVNTTYSASHVPLEIYEGYAEILNVVEWSQSLDQLFQENLHNYPDLHWQYFGSQTGLMRIYPATKWESYPGLPDLFDVRQRPWYVHGITSPKDIVILMDTSGSMHGQTMEIMKVAVKILLQSLGENDYVNVAWFSNEADWVSCFTTLVQGNDRNKKILIDAIDEVKDGNMASLALGLDFAFQQLAAFQANKSETWQGSDCHQVITLFSDGGTEEAWDIVLKWNKEKHVRIFSYAVGPHPIPYATLKELACMNRGVFTHISGLGSIRTKVQEYLRILSRPLVYSGEKHFQWTNFYLDSMGLGLMTTVTLPVYNRTDKEHQTVVGVMGIDITLQELMTKEPHYEIGPLGYSFSINRNGYVVFHPQFRSKIPEDFLDDAPLWDLLDIEVESPSKHEVRRAMIDQERGHRNVQSLVRSLDQKHLVEASMEFYYVPLGQTTFSLSLAFPTYRTHYLVARGLPTVAGLNLQPSDFLAPWKYCPNTTNLALTIQTESHLCDETLVQRVLWDIKKTDDLLHYWQADQDKRESTVQATFVITEGGLTRVFPATNKESLLSQSDPRNSLYYHQALLQDGYTFISHASSDDDNITFSTGQLTVVKAVNIRDENYKPAIVGANLEESWLSSILLSHNVGNSFSCSNPGNIICYMIDDGGFILTSNLNNAKIGSFLGYVDPELMGKLVAEQVFHTFEEYNYQARCRKERIVSAGPRNTDMPFLHHLLIDWTWLFNLNWSHYKGALMSLIGSLLWGESNAWSLPAELALELTDFRLCTTVQVIYYPGGNTSFTGNILCNNCSRWYGGTKLGKTNTYLIMTSPSCSPYSCEPLPPMIQAPVETFVRNKCNITSRYRRRPERCYMNYADEGMTECSGSKLPSFLWIVSTNIFILLLAFKF